MRADRGVTVIAIIPARLGSTRFPGKVLADRTGKPLIQHVYESARRASCLSRIIVATDDERVRAAVANFGGECIMTSPDHPNGTSRLAEACEKLGISADPGHEIIVNVQGDEPELDPRVIEAAVSLLHSAPANFVASTVAAPFAVGDDPSNPNIVKVVRRLDGSALYFSRSRLPFDRDGGDAPEAAPLRHIGLYCYRRRFLAEYIRLSQAPLEHAEKLEQLRILEHGYAMAVAVVPAEWCSHAGIDTPEQYEAFVRRAG